ncbi:hypothetical protein B0H12DRAFT_1157738 [Mycena haematopus]|nr:hypothetical protein B0H12DRAFT_1157738 [Mycena haematopus]
MVLYYYVRLSSTLIIFVAILQYCSSFHYLLPLLSFAIRTQSYLPLAIFAHLHCVPLLICVLLRSYPIVLGLFFVSSAHIRSFACQLPSSDHFLLVSWNLPSVVWSSP